MKKILIVGDGNHQLVTSYSLYLKKSNQNFEFDIISYKEVKKDHSYSNIYTVEIPKFLKKYPKLFSLIFYIKICLLYFKVTKKQYDVMHFHMAFPGIRYMLIKKSNAKKILTIWGSDFYKAGKFKKKLLTRTILKMDVLTFSNPQMQIDLQKDILHNTPVRIIPYFIQPLEELKKITQAIDVPADLVRGSKKINVVIGHNNNFNQNHLQILNQLIKIPNIQKKAIFILPLTYGRGGTENIKRIKEFLINNNFDFEIYSEDMTNKEIAELRLKTDIFIQLQKTDQLSGAMLEHMFARSIVVTGSWLPYSILKNNMIYFRTINEISELPNELEWCLTNNNIEYAKTKKNPDIIYEMFGAEKSIKKWSSLYFK